MATILIHIKPPKSEIKLKNIRIHTDTPTGHGQDQSFFGYEIMSFSAHKGSLDKMKVALADGYSEKITSNLLSSLIDLITGSWRETYKVERRKRGLNQFGDFDPTVRKFSLSTKLQFQLEKGLDVLHKSKHLRVALERWHSGIRRGDSLDAILDFCSSLEACFGLKSELRLRLSFAVRSVLTQKKKSSGKVVYEMYGIRNEFIHGSGIPSVQAEDEWEFASVVSRTLLGIISSGKIPTGDEIKEEIFS